MVEKSNQQSQQKPIKVYYQIGPQKMLNSSEEEADTILILYAAGIHQTGYDVHKI